MTSVSLRIVRCAWRVERPSRFQGSTLYAKHAAGEDRPWLGLLAEQSIVRAATLALLRSLPPAAWTHVGTVNGYSATARGLAFLIAGHELHHLRVIRERYLPLLT